MAERRPLVLIGGNPTELPEGDSLPVSAIGAFPFYKADGSSDPINLTSDNKLPFFDSTGTASNIPLVI